MNESVDALILDRDCILPDWPAPRAVRAFVTTRAGGVSTGARASLDLGGHTSVENDVLENRRRVRALLPNEPHWMHQVHGKDVVTLDRSSRTDAWPRADAAVTASTDVVCAVRVADCLPVLLSDVGAGCVGVAHAGWRGLAAGVLEATVDAMRALGSAQQIAWLGPAIGPAAFEVGAEVREAVGTHDEAALACFTPGAPGKWHADLYALARLRLRSRGVHAVHGGGLCTRTDAKRFFSYRREPDTGRMAALIWLHHDSEAPDVRGPR